MNRRFRDLVYSIPGVIVGAVVAHGCSAEVTPPEPTYADPFYCDFRCPERGVADGNASISGTPSVDGFFASIIRFQTAADTIGAGIRTELDAIGASVGARAGDDADLKEKLDAFLSSKVTDFKVHYQPVRCTLSARALLAAEAKCDANVDSATAVVQCDGSCNVNAGAEGDCGGSGTVSCVGTAPDLDCPGTCQGDCELLTPAVCFGTCNGSCEGNCTVTNNAGDCAGSCDGKCTGRCRTDGGATCTGRCTGQCTYIPPNGACNPTAQARCDAKENATMDCRGYCSGHLKPPKAKAECEAQAKVDAGVDAECRPPAIDLSYQLSAAIAGDTMATASFQAWLEGFERHVSAILAYEAKIDGLRSTAEDLGRNARSAINDSIDNTIHGHLTLMQVVGLACAGDQLPGIFDSIASTGTRLSASAKSAIDVLGSLGVS